MNSCWGRAMFTVYCREEAMFTIHCLEEAMFTVHCLEKALVTVHCGEEAMFTVYCRRRLCSRFTAGGGPVHGSLLGAGGQGHSPVGALEQVAGLVLALAMAI